MDVRFHAGGPGRQNRAATRVQASYRGKLARAELGRAEAEPAAAEPLELAALDGDECLRAPAVR